MKSSKAELRCGRYLAAFLVGAALLRPLALSAAPSDAPVCRWTFDGQLVDSAGSVRDTLTVQGVARARFVGEDVAPGVVGKAVALNVETGDASHLVAANSTDIRLGASYTIEAWVHPAWQPRQVAPWQRLVLNWGGSGQYAYHLAIHNGVASLYHGQADGSYVFAEGGRIDAGRWQHLAGVARRNDADPARSRLEVYLNGHLVASGAYDGTICAAEKEGLGLGDSVSIANAESRFRGYLDEVTMWNRALSADDLRGHYDQRAPVLEKIARQPRKIPPAEKGLVDQFDALGVEEIVFCERGAGRDISGHYYANFGYACIDTNIWFHAADGTRLCRLNPKTSELSVLLDDPGGSVRDPCVHYDGNKVLFSYRKGGTHQYHLYEIDSDGSGLRQLTDGPWDDVEPAYLPDGGIVFASTRCKRYILCWLAQSATLHRCDADPSAEELRASGGKNIRMLSSNTVTENTPCVLPDGRILYTRWEYVNRDAVVFHHFWTMNPDGTGVMVYFGNMHPGGVFIDAQPIAGTRDVVFIHSPGHGRNEHVGQVAIVSDRLGPDERSAMHAVTRGSNYRDPYPLSPEAFLAAKGNQLVLLDRKGREQVVYAGRQMVHEPRLLAARPRERAIPPRVDMSREDATVILSDVYFGRNMAGVERGAIKKMLVMEDLPKPANYHGGGSQPLGHGVSSTLKRILGTVPVEPDGSAHFSVPPMRSIYLALLDENDISVKQMRSFMTLQPGETASCVGCHEPRLQSPSGGLPTLAALNRSPSRIKPIDGVPEVMDFPRDIQPILDRHCVKCHDSAKRKGGVVLTGDRGPVYSLSYYNLLLHWQIKDTKGDPKNGTGRQRGNDAPYTTYSSASPLMKKIDGSHHKVKLTQDEHRMVRLWIDVNAPYPGTVAALGTGQVGGCWAVNKPIRVMANAWPSTKAAAAAVQRRCTACHGKWLPKHVTDLVPVGPHQDMLAWTRPLSRISRHRVFNLTRPDRSLILLAPLAKAAGGYAAGEPKKRKVTENRNAPPKPVTHPVVFADRADPDYCALLTHIQVAGAKLDEIKRFDMPGFRPSEHYVREMKRYGVLPANLDPAASVDPYATDRAYWRSFWHVATETGP
jgi:hypothetical protein